jgi:hypothetical protein
VLEAIGENESRDLDAPPKCHEDTKTRRHEKESILFFVFSCLRGPVVMAKG